MTSEPKNSMRAHYLQLLKLNLLFNDFTTEELTNFFNSSNSKISTYKGNTVIYFEGEKCSSMDIILEGKVIIQKIDKKGNILTITEFGPGNSVGCNLLFSESPFYPMTVISKSEVTLFNIYKNSVLELCHNSKSFLTAYLKNLSDKAAILANKIKTISMKSIRETVIDFLTYEYNIQRTTKIKLSTSKKEMAERFGIQRTSLSRELAKMRDDGLISYDAHSITINEPNSLKRNKKKDSKK